MSLQYAIIDNQYSVDHITIEEGKSSKPLNTSLPTFTRWYVNYKYPDGSKKKLLFVTDHMKLISNTALGNIRFETELEGTNPNHLYMMNMIDSIVETIKKPIIAKYGDTITFSTNYNHSKMKITTKTARGKCITPIIIQQSKKKGGNKIQIKDLSLFDTDKMLKSEILQERYKVKTYKIKNGETQKDIYYECKFILGFEILIVDDSKKLSCIIKLVASRVDIKYNVTKALTSIDKDITILIPQESATKKLEI